MRQDLLVDVHNVRITVRFDTFLAPFASNAALLGSRKEGEGIWLLPRVNEDTAGLEAMTGFCSSFYVCRPDTCTESGCCIIRPPNDFFFVIPRLGWNNWAEWLLLNDAAIVGGIVDNGWLDEETFTRGDVGLANGELVAFVLQSDMSEIKLMSNQTHVKR